MSAEEGEIKEAAENVSEIPPEGTEKVADGESSNSAVNEPEDEWVDILGSGQLRKRVIKKGTEHSRPQRGDMCTLRIEGRLQDGTLFENFDSFEIQVGDTEVVQGLDLAVPLMDEGEVAEVEIHPRFGYGTIGKEPDVPPSAVLMYTIELLKSEPEPEFEEMSIEKRGQFGNRKRERGNWWFSRNEHPLAIQCYRRALDYLDTDGGITAGTEARDSFEQLKPILAERLKVYNNLAASQMKIQAFDSALSSVENVLRCEPNNIKALFRKGKILAEKGDFEKSVEIFKQANKIEPDNKPIQQELARVTAKSKQELSKQKNLYRRMLGQSDDEKKLPKNAQKEQLPTKFSWRLIAGSAAALATGVILYKYRTI